MDSRPARSRRLYESRMHRVLEYIDAHLAEDLALDRLAEVASFSSYHFHRLFAAWHGERLGDFVRRRRLEVAAARLLSQPSLPVLHVALGVGFGSGEAFTRAFKERFGCSPTAWRLDARQDKRKPGKARPANSNLDQAPAPRARNHGGSQSQTLELPMQVGLQTLPPVLVAYLRYTGPYGAPINHFWRETAFPWMVTNGLLGRARYGISLDDPSITDPAKCRYDACVPVEEGAVLTGTAQTMKLPGGRYAVLDYFGTSEAIGEAWNAILRDWLPSSNLQLDGRPCFEHYPANARHDEATGSFECQICVPVAPL